MFALSVDDIVVVYDLSSPPRVPLHLRGSSGVSIVDIVCGTISGDVCCFGVCSDGVVRKWVVPNVKKWSSRSPTSLKPSVVMAGHEDIAVCCSIGGGAQGLMLASGSFDKTVRVWNSQNGTCERVLRGHDSCVRQVAWTFEGTIFSCSQDGTVREWSLAKEDCLRVWDVRYGCIDMKVTARHVFVLDVTHRICCWNRETNVVDHVYIGSTARITKFAVYENGRYVVAASRDGNVVRYDVEREGNITVFEGYEGPVSCFGLSGEQLYVGFTSGCVRSWIFAPSRALLVTTPQYVSVRMLPRNVQLVIYCQALVRRTRVQRFVERNRAFFPHSLDRFKAARQFLVSESSFALEPADVRSFAKHFGQGPGDTITNEHVEAVFDILCKLHAWHANIVAKVKVDIERTWPFYMDLAPMIQATLPELVGLTKQYLAHYALCDADLHKCSKLHGLKLEELRCGFTLDNLLDGPFVYFLRQIPPLKLLCRHTNAAANASNFGSLAELLGQYQSLSSDLSEARQRIANARNISNMQALIPLHIGTPQQDTVGLFQDHKRVVEHARCKIEKGLSAFVFLLDDVIVCGSDSSSGGTSSSNTVVGSVVSRKRSQSIPHFVEIIPLVQCRIETITGSSPKDLVLSHVGHPKPLIITFASSEQASHWRSLVSEHIQECKARVLGVPLAQVLAKESLSVPMLLAQLAIVIRESRVDVFEMLLSLIDRKELSNIRTASDVKANMKPSVAFASIIRFLRALPEPLIPFEEYNSFLLHAQDVSALKMSCAMLPPSVRDVLSHVCRTIHEACMSSLAPDSAVALVSYVLGPAILRHRRDFDHFALDWVLTAFVPICSVAQTLVRHADKIFPRDLSGPAPLPSPPFSKLPSPNDGSQTERSSRTRAADSAAVSHTSTAGGVSPRKQYFRAPSVSVGDALDAGARRSLFLKPFTLSMPVRQPKNSRDEKEPVAKTKPLKVSAPAAPEKKDNDGDDDDDDDIVILPMAGRSPPPLPEVKRLDFSDLRKMGGSAAGKTYRSYLLELHVGTKIKRRFYVLNNGQLKRFRKADSVGEPTDTYELKDLNVSFGKSLPENSFRLESPNVSLVLQAEAPDAFAAWVSLLQELCAKK